VKVITVIAEEEEEEEEYLFCFHFFFNKRKKTVTNMRERILSNEMRIDRKIGGGVRVSFLVELSGLSFSSIVYMSNALSVFHTHARTRARTHARTIICRTLTISICDSSRRRRSDPWGREMAVPLPHQPLPPSSSSCFAFSLA